MEVQLGDDIEDIWEFSLQGNKPMFHIKWKDNLNLSNSWEDYDDIKDSHVFKEYINNLQKSYAVEIQVNNENYRKNLANEIKGMKMKSPATCNEILKKKNFDDFKFKTLQLLYHFLMPNEVFKELFQEMFILNEVHMAQQDQLEKFQVSSVRMQTIDRYTVISLENNIDWKWPDSFKYIKNNIISNSIPSNALAGSSNGCSCAHNCKITDQCCGSSYELNSKGEICLKNLDDQAIIECGDTCKCNKACVNRCTQSNTAIRAVTIFKTKKCGWGVKTDNGFAKGSFIFECIGVVTEKSIVMHKQQKSYFFHFKHNDKAYVIDAYESGNIARFINHSCNPNANIFQVMDKGNNLKSTRLNLFALRDIQENEEITVNYDKCSIGCLNNSLKCLCGSAECNGFIYSSKKLSSDIEMTEALPPKPKSVLANFETPTHPMQMRGKNIDHILVVHAPNKNVKPEEDLLDEISLDGSVNVTGRKKCTECDYEGLKHALQQHRLKVHNIGNAMICSCGFIFLKDCYYQTHMRLINNEKHAETFADIIKNKKKELKLNGYRWIHNERVRAPKPDNAEYVHAYANNYINYLTNSLPVLHEIQQKHFTLKKSK